MRPDETWHPRWRNLPADVLAVAQDCRRVRGAVRTPGGRLTVELISDSPHLIDFFKLNWHAPDEVAIPDVSIIGLRGDARYYGLSPSLDGFRWVDRDFKTLYFMGNESYANLKISVRGIISAQHDSDLVWTHGCSLLVDTKLGPRGVLVMGRSGAGKTTITAEMRRQLGANRSRIINDDWGAVRLSDRNIFYTGEQHLHMKYASAAAHNPSLIPSPVTHRSENFSGDRFDPVARLLISPTEVFGSNGCALNGELAAIFVLTRSPETLPGVVPVQGNFINDFDRGEYSPYYSANERFLNGSLLLLSPEEIQYHRLQFERLFGSVPTLMVGNVGTVDKPGEDLLHELNNVADNKVIY